MQARIKAHQVERGSCWNTIEEPMDLTGVLRGHSHGNAATGNDDERVVLVDCLTLWLSNVMFADKDVRLEIRELVNVIADYRGNLVIVSNEVGMGLVPDTKVGRTFRDAQGLVNQKVAEVVDIVEFVVAGVPMRVKP